MPAEAPNVQKGLPFVIDEISGWRLPTLTNPRLIPIFSSCRELAQHELL